MLSTNLQPPANHENRPEKAEFRPRFFDHAGHALSGLLKRRYKTGHHGLTGIIRLVDKYGVQLEGMSDQDIKSMAGLIGTGLARTGFCKDQSARAFALVREVAHRTLGFRHYDVQLLGGWAMLRGMVAEMETGEGKTLTATLSACTSALAGIPVHVISVNDYLTARDAEWMGPVYRALGLSVGCVTHGKSPLERRDAYSCDVTYCTNKEIVFDYLKDLLVLKDRADPLRLSTSYLCGNHMSRRLMLRGLSFAIVDEADSILIDEARTPLVISGGAGSREEHDFMVQTFNLSGELEELVDYICDRSARKIDLTSKGKRKIRKKASGFGSLWAGSVRREDQVRKALSARHLFARDEDYLVIDGKVQIVDEFTGRLMPDRTWERGLHQLIEIKEGCCPTLQRETLAKISYQRFFRRYIRLAGMTGTAKEVQRELWSVYGLPVVRIPTNRPVRRRKYPDRILPTVHEKWKAVVDRVGELNRMGRPVLIGTRSVAASEFVGKLFDQANLEHKILNARQNREEAEIVAKAGKAGQITVATNMAGRGTDIKLAPGVAEIGGLHVILTERHESIRIDRQLFGRCGRQGDPGGFEAIVSLDDPIVNNNGFKLLRSLAGFMVRLDPTLWTWCGKLLIKRGQKYSERYHKRVRRDLFNHDMRKGEMLSFSGRFE